MFETKLISFILSQFIGLYVFIVAVSMFIRAREYRQLVNKMNPDSGTILLAGLMGLLLGLFLVGIHNVWVFKPIVFITLFCWLVLLVSMMCLVAPEKLVSMIKKRCAGSNYYVFASVMLFIGLLFFGRGVYQYATHAQDFLFLNIKL